MSSSASLGRTLACQTSVLRCSNEMHWGRVTMELLTPAGRLDGVGDNQSSTPKSCPKSESSSCHEWHTNGIRKHSQRLTRHCAMRGGVLNIHTKQASLEENLYIIQCFWKQERPWESKHLNQREAFQRRPEQLPLCLTGRLVRGCLHRCSKERTRTIRISWENASGITMSSKNLSDFPNLSTRRRVQLAFISFSKHCCICIHTNIQTTYLLFIISFPWTSHTTMADSP